MPPSDTIIGLYGPQQNVTNTDSTDCICNQCGRVHAESDTEIIEAEHYCRDCVIICPRCDTLHTANSSDVVQAMDRQGQEVDCCADCTWTCSNCEGVYTEDVPNEVICGNCVCRDCLERCYTGCNECGIYYPNEEIYYCENDGRSYCADCMPSEDEQADGLYGHDYKPRTQWFSLPGDLSHAPKVYLGVEIEVDGGSEDIETSIINAGLADTRLWYCKADSSLDNGFEAVSHPATFEYWQAQNFKWCDELRADGWRSYDTTTCGMHVHISRDYFSALDIYKLLVLFRNNKGFITRVSRRREDRLRQWAEINTGEMTTLTKKSKDKDANGNRYEAINLRNEDTIEFRIFRGTLNVPSIKLNLAFVRLLSAYVKQASIKKLWAKHFIAWVKLEGHKYIAKRTQAEKNAGVIGLQARFVAWMSTLANGHESEQLEDC